MTRFVDLSIRTQLIILAMILIVPALTIIVYSGYREYVADYRQARLESQRLAETVAAQQEVLIREAKQLCLLLTELPEVRHKNAAKTHQILANIQRESTHFSDILVADSAGNVWASAINKPRSVAQKRYFKNAREPHKFAAGEYVVSNAIRKPTIHLAYPLTDRGVFQGVVAVAFDLDILKTILEKTKMPDYSNYILTDHQGIIVSRGKNVGQEIGKPIKPEDLQRMENGPETETYEFTRIDGERRITTYRKLWLDNEKVPFLYVRAGMSKTVALAPAKRALLINVILLSLFVSVAFGIAFTIGKRSIVDRIAILKQAAQRLAGGNLSEKVSNQIAGGELGSLSTIFDDMAQKIALREKSLLESESSYRDIFNATHDALFVHETTSGKIIEVNRRAETMFGYSREEFLQPSASAAPTPDYLPENEAGRLRQAVSEGTQEFECLSRRKSGELLWIEVTLAPTSLACGSRILAMVRDITVRKEMERIKEEMLSTVSHEMRTPLTAMLGFLEFVIENPVDEVQMRDYHFIMQKEAERLNEMVNNFLDMQRLKSKKSSYSFTPLDVRPLMAEAASIFTGPASKHRIIEELPVELPQVLGNAELLHQAFRNLLSNAVKYSAEGSKIVFGAIWEKDTVIVWVKDEGIGIPPDALELIFDMFYRVDSTGRNAAGTGLGLALVKEIVDSHNGKVWVESTLNQGCTFYITLPAATTSQA